MRGCYSVFPFNDETTRGGSLFCIEEVKVSHGLFPSNRVIFQVHEGAALTEVLFGRRKAISHEFLVLGEISHSRDVS